MAVGSGSHSRRARGHRRGATVRAAVGRRTELLLERPGRKPGQLIGKSPWLQSVHVETGAAIGDLVEVEIVSAGPNSLAGAELVKVAA